MLCKEVRIDACGYAEGGLFWSAQWGFLDVSESGSIGSADTVQELKPVALFGGEGRDSRTKI